MSRNGEDEEVQRLIRERRLSDAQRKLGALRPGRGKDERKRFAQDRSRIVYAIELMRLGGVTQMVAPSIARRTHDRLTHSLKVEDVSWAIAVSFADRRSSAIASRRVAKAGVTVDPVVAGAAGLAHDIGHAPFGHVGELALDDWLNNETDGRVRFEGNAQAFRVLTRLATKRDSEHGLDLTYATLAATLKYPWPLRAARPSPGPEGRSKYGYYPEDEKIALTVLASIHGRSEESMRGLAHPDSLAPTVEAQVMDLADDLSYATHDLRDFILTGQISADFVCSEADRYLGRISSKPRDSFFSDPDTLFDRARRSSASRASDPSWDAMMKTCWAADERLPAIFNAARPPATHPDADLDPVAKRHAYFADWRVTDERLSGWVSDTISVALETAELRDCDRPPYALLDFSLGETLYIESLKFITMDLVVNQPRLALLQYAQKRMIESLCELILDLWRKNQRSDPGRIPPRLNAVMELAQSDESTKECWEYFGVRDFVSGLTDQGVRAWLDLLEGRIALNPNEWGTFDG